MKMAEQNSKVVLTMKNVKYCKNEGYIQITSKCFEWIKLDDSNPHISISFTDIKNQKISPEGKSKVQLQLVLYDQSTHNFHFANPSGIDTQKEERNKVKEVVTQLVLKTRKKQPDELLEKKRILDENPHLKELYMSLVPTEILPVEEFWKEIAGKYKESLIPDLDIGVSGAFLADIKPQTDGTNGRVMYNLTPEIMTAVFKTYPAVKKKHEEYVPHQMTESEFWTRFFQSHYYSTHSTSRTENVFSECAKHDDKEWAKDLNSAKSDPLYDLNDIYEDKPLQMDSELKSSRGKSGSNVIHATMIKRFNQHSLNILKSQAFSEKEKLTNELETKTQEKAPSSQNHVNGHSQQPAKPEEDSSTAKKRKINDKLEYEDLETASDESKSSLVIHQRNRYLAGPSADPHYRPDLNLEQLPYLHHKLSCSVRSWRADLHACQSSSRANKVLCALSSASKKSSASGLNSSSGGTLPTDVHNELGKIYRSSGELFRHFWSCFPPRTPQLQEKLHRMHSTLSKFHESTVREFRDKVGGNIQGDDHVLRHIQQMFFIANNKYESWKDRNGR